MPRKPRSHHGGDDQPELPGGEFAPASRTPAANARATPGTRAPRNVSRHFLGWERPLVQGVVARLAEGWDGRGALDLSDWLIVVPTRNASRRLREALALHAAGHDAAVLPPMTVTPDFLTTPENQGGENPAGRVETLLLWAAELLRLDLAEYRRLFPVDPVERSFTWALKTAEDIIQLRETLNENGLSLADAARRFDGTEMEPERWGDLARLERHCVMATEARGFSDWQSARRRAACAAPSPPQARRVMIAGVLDPSGLAIQALERHAQTLPVEVMIFAPESSHRDHFDEWGRPVASKWLAGRIHIPEPGSTIHHGSTPAGQAAIAMELLRPYAHPGEVAAIGVADTEVSAPLEKALAAQEIGAYDPAGSPMERHGVFHLLRVLSRLCGSRAFGAVAELIRCPDVAGTIRGQVEKRIGARPSLTRLFTDLDELAVKALPDTLDDAIELAPRVFDEDQDSPVIAALAWVRAALHALEGADFGTALTDFLGDVFAARRFRSDNPQDAVFAAIADQITEVLDALDGSAALMPGIPLSAGSRLELLLRVLEGQVFYPERKARDMDLQGWLELLWEDAPHLIITGMNDGKAPEAILGHTYLPDSARRVLGLRDNDTRFARDACLMTALIESRRHTGGRADFIFGRTDAAGAPLRPSRLLFQCDDKELPGRTLHFFQKSSPGHDPVPWQLAWRLQPRPLPDDAPILHRLSVTQFASYLQCPFRFYLRHGLRMAEIDTSRTEMDAMEFGSLLHGVLDAFAQDSDFRALADADQIRDAFHSILDRRLHAAYGARLTVPVTIQRESARQRLGWWAEKEAEQRREGWQIVASETYLSSKDDPWMLAGMAISGRIDRIERHEQQGVRLVDFKTRSAFDSRKKARKTVENHHLTPLKRDEEPESLPEWALVTGSDGTASRWTDLQLPLYRLAMERRFHGERITTAHVTLSKTKPEIGLDDWPGLDGPLLESARACAEGVISAIRARVFWPPAEKLPFSDDFGHLFLGEPLEAVDASLLTGQPISPA